MTTPSAKTSQLKLDLRKLWEEHIVWTREYLNSAILGAGDAGEVVKAAKAGDAIGLAAADKKWHDNGNQIADFLSSANPNWPNDQMKAMMNDNLNLTRQEAVDMLAKRTDATIADYDKVHNQILNMSDMLAEGIIKQYPNKF